MLARFGARSYIEQTPNFREESDNMHAIEGYILLVGMSLVMFVGLWNNWIFTGPDGYMLTGKDRPSLLRFYATLLRHPLQTFDGRIFWPTRLASERV